MSHQFFARRKRGGFTLIEVMIAMVVTAVGLLGLAKMQALAVSGSKSAGSRSLIALQVGSMVSAMHANTAYWATTAVPTTFGITGSGTITNGGGVLDAAIAVTDCIEAAPCAPAKMAARDFQNWGSGMFDQFPTYGSSFVCTNAVPISCQIYVTWTEKRIGFNETTKGGSDSQIQSFSVSVKP